MKTYLARRLLALIPVALVVATVAFVLMHLAPGDPASVIAGPYASADDVKRLQHQLGLDAPLPAQLVRWYARLPNREEASRQRQEEALSQTPSQKAGTSRDTSNSLCPLAFCSKPLLRIE